MGNTGDHIRGFAHRMTYEEYEELEDTVTEMLRHKKEGDSVEGFDPSFLNGLYEYPTVQDLQELQVFCHLSKYLPWLVFLDANDLGLRDADYRDMKRYVRRGLSQYIILT